MRLLRFSILLILSAAFLNINCSNNKYKQIKQTPVDKSETAQSAKPAEMTSQQAAETQKAKPAEESAKAEQSENKSKYQYPDDNGIGPVKEVKVGAIDPRLVAKGNEMRCVPQARFASCGSSSRRHREEKHSRVHNELSSQYNGDAEEGSDIKEAGRRIQGYNARSAAY